MRGAEYVILESAALTHGLFWAERSQEPADSESNNNSNKHLPLL